MKTTWDAEAVTGFGSPGAVAQTRRAERDVCRWSMKAIPDMTMVEADAAIAVDPLFHLECDGHLGRVDVRHWYFRPEFKYLVCRLCSERGDPSVIEPEVVGCQHRIPAN